MNNVPKPDLSPQEETAVDLHKSFLVANAQAYATYNARAFEDAAKFARQAIRGLFLLHGACATAVIATGMIDKMKIILFVLGIGALFSVVTAWCAFFLHRKVAEYDKRYTDIILREHFSMVHRVVMPKVKVNGGNVTSACRIKYNRCFWFYGMVIFGSCSIISFAFVLWCLAFI